MYAKKDNKVYTVDEQSKKTYLAQGYDIYEDNGEISEKSPKSTVPYEAYSKLEAELTNLKAEKTKCTKGEA